MYCNELYKTQEEEKEEEKCIHMHSTEGSYYIKSIQTDLAGKTYKVDINDLLMADFVWVFFNPHIPLQLL